MGLRGGVKIDSDRRKCTCCGEPKHKTRGFYKSYSILYKANDNRTSICRDCAIEIFNSFVGSIENVEQSVFYTCRLLDMYFDKTLFLSVLEQAQAQQSNVMQIYFQKVNSLMQYDGKTFVDSELSPSDETTLNNADDAIPVELITRWGEGYTKTKIMQLETFYRDMMISHEINLPQHKKLLVIMCKLNLKMDECLEQDDLKSFSSLHTQYQKLLQSSGFRPIDNKGSSESSGIRTFSQIFEEVERDGFIKPVPISEHQDIVDKTIQYEMNYLLKLLQQQPLTEPPIDTPKADDADG